MNYGELMPEWKLNQVFKNGINQRALCEELIKADIVPYVNELGALTKKINLLKNQRTFLKSKDPVYWYLVFRAWLDVSPMELIGVKTDDEAVQWILEQKLKLPKGVSIDVSVEEVKPVSLEVQELYILVGRRQKK